MDTPDAAPIPPRRIPSRPAPRATGAAEQPGRYVARSAEDLLALVPVVLGFEPEDSVVLLTFGSSRPFHARVDLPREPQDVPLVARTLVDPARRHAVERVVLVAYADDGRRAGHVLRGIAEAFVAHRIEVLTCLRAHAGRWWPVSTEVSGEELGPGRPYDAATHEFRARSVLDGRVTLPDRAAVAARVAPGPGGAVDAVLDALGRTAPPSVRELDALVVDLLATGACPDDEQVASLLLAAAVPRCRDQVYRRLLRGTAAQHVSLWSEVVRRAPERWAADASAVLALAAWVSGDGALAWCAVERAQSGEPEHHLAGLVAALLERALPPEEWERIRRPLAG